MASANGSAAAAAQTDPAAAFPDASEVPSDPAAERWPGWPGYSVFRLVVPVTKVGSIIGRKGELIKKMCEESGAKIRILDGISGTTDRVVLVSGKEDPDAKVSASMDAVLRVFKRTNGLGENEGDGASAAPPTCSVRLLVASPQAISLIGKGGTTIKGIQEGSGATIRVLNGEELPFHASNDDRLVDIQGESLKVLQALELVLGHLRKFLVDPSVIPLFDKTNTLSSSVAQDLVSDSFSKALISAVSQPGIASDFSSLKHDALFRDPEPPVDFHFQRSGLSLYGQDPALSVHSSGITRTAGAIVTQVTQSMQIPLAYAEDIIGPGGSNIAYIRRTSGAIISVHETRGIPDEITVEVKGTLSQVQAAQQLVQESISGHREAATSVYSKPDSGYLSSYSHLGSSYPSSSLTSRTLGGYASAGGLGGYGGYRY